MPQPPPQRQRPAVGMPLAAPLQPSPERQHPPEPHQSHGARQRQNPQPPEIRRLGGRLAACPLLGGHRRRVGRFWLLRRVGGVGRLRCRGVGNVGLVGFFRLRLRHSLLLVAQGVGRRGIHRQPALARDIVLHPGVGAVLGDQLGLPRRAGDGVARDVPRRDAQGAHQKHRGRGEVDAVAPLALGQKVEHEVLPRRDGRGIQVIGAQLPHPHGRRLLGGHGGEPRIVDDLLEGLLELLGDLEVVVVDIAVVGRKIVPDGGIVGGIAQLIVRQPVGV